MTDYRVTFARVVRSEWTKYWSLRSTWIVLAGTVLATVGLAGAVGWAQGRSAKAPTVSEVIGGTFLSIDLFSLVVAVLGIMTITGEYGSGLIRATLAAVPRRVPVLAAKALVLVAATTPVLVVASFSSLFVSLAFSNADVGLGDPGVLRAVLGAAAAPVAFGVLGLGLGTALRHTAGAITAMVLTMLILPALLPALPGSVPDDIAPYSPIAAAQAMYSVGGTGGPFKALAPGAAALVVAGWVALTLAAAGTVLRSRDA
jgi:ABC-2 type transport system permease protein